MNSRFSICIVHRNGLEKLNNVLTSLLSQITENDEIIVIDNHSNDKSIETIEGNKKFQKIVFIKNKCNAGYGFACNQGIYTSKGKYILLCNNDLEFSENALNEFEELHKKNLSAGIIGPQLISSNDLELNSYGTIKIDFLSQLDLIGRPKRSKRIKNFSSVETLRGACLCAKREMINELGGFDKDFYFYHEDTEWCFRINKSKKWQVMFAPSIRMKHLEGSSSSKMFKESRIEFYRSRIIFWKKIFSPHEFLIIFCWNFIKLFLDLIFYQLMSILYFIRSKKYNQKVMDRYVVLGWIFMGMPEKWGLPDKCIYKNSKEN